MADEIPSNKNYIQIKVKYKCDQAGCTLAQKCSKTPGAAILLQRIFEFSKIDAPDLGSIISKNTWCTIPNVPVNTVVGRYVQSYVIPTQFNSSDNLCTQLATSESSIDFHTKTQFHCPPKLQFRKFCSRIYMTVGLSLSVSYVVSA